MKKKTASTQELKIILTNYEILVPPHTPVIQITKRSGVQQRKWLYQCITQVQ